MKRQTKPHPTGPIRLGIVGLGRAGWSMHCQELKRYPELFRIVAACDVEQERLDRMAQTYGCRTYQHVKDLISDPHVELVDIATRSCDHVRQALQAIQARKPVFLEKPMAVSYAEAKKLLSAATRYKVPLFIRHNRRFEPPYLHIRQIMASGILGEIFEIKLRRNGYQRRNDWQAISRFGGGQLLNWGPHIVDHGLRLLESPVASVWTNTRRIAAAGDAEDHLKIILEGKNGRLVDLEISGGSALGEPEWMVFGAKGALSCSGSQIRLRYLNPKKKLPARRAIPTTPPQEGPFGGPDSLEWIDETIEAKSPTGDDMGSIWEHLYRSLREGRAFAVTLPEALEVMRIISIAKKGIRFTTNR